MIAGVLSIVTSIFLNFVRFCKEFKLRDLRVQVSFERVLAAAGCSMLSLGGAMETAEIRWIGKQEFAAKGPSGHAQVLDADRASNVGCGPMELLLLALGSCTATDLVIILEKKREKLRGLEVICCGERAKEPPRVWTK